MMAFADHLLLFRQEKIFGRNRLVLPSAASGEFPDAALDVLESLTTTLPSPAAGGPGIGACVADTEPGRPIHEISIIDIKNSHQR
jgi:hypothetical protein